MRILHTSDWHLGKTLHGLDMLEHQHEFVEEMVRVVDSQNVDCVIIAGDVFDKGVPPLGAVQLFSDALSRLADRCAVVVTSGNHDSAIRLGAGSALYRAGVNVVTDPIEAGDQLDLHVQDVHVRIFPFPYLDPDHCRQLYSPGEPLPRSHQAVMAAAVERAWQRDAELAITPHARIAVAHAFVAGGERSDSERDITVGGVDSISASTFSGFDYVALGHLHRPQQVNAAGKVRYSGSPLRYSFSEVHHNKSVTLVDIDQTGVTSISVVPIAQPRNMVELVGTLAEVLSAENVIAHHDDWVRVVITDQARPKDLVDHIRNVFPNALSILHEPVASIPAQAIGPRAIDLRDPVSVSVDFVTDVTTNEPTADEVSVLRAAYDAARHSSRQ